MVEELFDDSDRKLDDLTENQKWANHRLASLEQDGRQPRLAMAADVPADKETRERTEGAATAVQAMHGDSFCANRIDHDPMYSTSFGVKAEPPDLPRRDDVLVENGAFFSSFFSLISLIADGPHHYHPACGHKGSSHLSPVCALQFFIAMQVQHSYNSSTNG